MVCLWDFPVFPLTTVTANWGWLLNKSWANAFSIVETKSSRATLVTSISALASEL
jgi:hypothetical protein